MNWKGLAYFFIVLTTVFFMASCLDINVPENEPTEAEELQLLSEYLDALSEGGNDIDTTDLGVYYVTIQEGEGNFPETGDTLEVGYAGYYIDGTLFDASDFYEEGGTFEFILGNPPIFEGWDNGMTVINKNAGVQLIIPSKLAYGSEGSGAIPPYRTLVFVVEMKEIKPAN